MSKAKRNRIEPNIYTYGAGHFEILMTVSGVTAAPIRFTAGTPIETVRAARDAQRIKMDAAARGRGDAPRAIAGGTLESLAPSFLDMIKGRTCFKSDRSHLRAWFEVVIDGQRLGELPLTAITKQHIFKTIAQWQSAPSVHAIRTIRVTGYAREACTISAHAIAGATVQAHARHGREKKIRTYTRSGTTIAAHPRSADTVGSYERSAPATSRAIVSNLTIRHRCRVLDEMFKKTTADGASPFREVKLPSRGKPLVVTVPPAIVISTLQTLAGLDAKTFARFAVAATTGQRPCQIGRAHPEDLDLTAAAAWWVVRDAKGEPAHPDELNADAVAAWQAFIAADAWSFTPTATRPRGGFDPSDYGKVIHEAGWPKGIRPYNARHSLAKAMIAAGCSLGDIQAHYGHADPNTTRVYAPFVRDRAREVSKRTEGHLGDVFKPRLVKRGR